MIFSGTFRASLPAALRSARGDRWRWPALGLLAFATALVLLTFTDYGVTWDEDLHNWYGGYVVGYYLSLFRDTRALHFDVMYYYGALFDTVAALLNRVSPLGVYETRHLLNGLIGIVGLAGCWKLGRAIGGPRAGFVALLFLLLTPNYYGQMFNNPKDIPFAVGFVWATYYMVRVLPCLPRPPWRLVVKLGVAIGFALGVRVGALLLPAYFGLVLLLCGVWEAIETRRAMRLVEFGWTGLWRAWFPAVAIAWAIMLLFWPYAQFDPIDNPLRALAFFSHQTFPYGTLFDGRFVPAWDLPWTYLPTHIVLALPELVLVLLAGAPLLAATALARRAGWQRDPVLAHFLLGFTIVFPVAYAIAIKAVLFDGMRHFIFLLPPIAVAAALVADRALAWLARFPYRQPIYAALALYGMAHVSVMVLLHPDQYVYYNAFVGGIEGAQRKFKLDYWANSYAEAVRGLVNYARAEYGADFEDHEFTVAVCGPPNPAVYYFPPNFRLLHQQAQADFYIAFTKDNCDRLFPGRPVYRVQRMDTLLSVVIDRREILAEQRVARRPFARAGSPRLHNSAFP
jgi:hypothetical protein